MLHCTTAYIRVFLSTTNGVCLSPLKDMKLRSYRYLLASLVLLRFSSQWRFSCNCAYMEVQALGLYHCKAPRVNFIVNGAIYLYKKLKNI